MKRIELLGPEYLESNQVLQDIDRWLAVLDRPNGWHYDLDITWLLQNLERSGVRPGMTVIDAGAGLGVTQFVLAARGFHVISLDYAERDLPRRAEGVFTVTRAKDQRGDYQHSYLTHVRGFDEQSGARSLARRAAARFATDPIAATLAVGDAARRVSRFLVRRRELTRDHLGFGAIEFVRASFDDLPGRTVTCSTSRRRATASPAHRYWNWSVSLANVPSTPPRSSGSYSIAHVSGRVSIPITTGGTSPCFAEEESTACRIFPSALGCSSPAAATCPASGPAAPAV